MIGRIIVTIAASMTVAAAPTHWSTNMTGKKETPANDSKGSGTATFSLNGNTLKYTVTAKGMSGPATAAHIHVGAVGVAGPPVYTFVIAIKGSTVSTGVIDLSTTLPSGIPGDSLRALLKNGNAYVNVHTAAHPMGEIRGQLVAK